MRTTTTSGCRIQQAAGLARAPPRRQSISAASPSRPTRCRSNPSSRATTAAIRAAPTERSILCRAALWRTTSAASPLPTRVAAYPELCRPAERYWQTRTPSAQQPYPKDSRQEDTEDGQLHSRAGQPNLRHNPRESQIAAARVIQDRISAGANTEKFREGRTGREHCRKQNQQPDLPCRALPRPQTEKVSRA